MGSTKQQLELETKHERQKGQVLGCLFSEYAAAQPEMVTGTLCKPTPLKASAGGSCERLTKTSKGAFSELAHVTNMLCFSSRVMQGPQARCAPEGMNEAQLSVPVYCHWRQLPNEHLLQAGTPTRSLLLLMERNLAQCSVSCCPPRAAHPVLPACAQAWGSRPLAHRAEQ